MFPFHYHGCVAFGLRALGYLLSCLLLGLLFVLVCYHVLWSLILMVSVRVQRCYQVNSEMSQVEILETGWNLAVVLILSSN